MVLSDGYSNFPVDKLHKATLLTSIPSINFIIDSYADCHSFWFSPTSPTAWKTYFARRLNPDVITSHPAG
jgi:hypothetical protein